MKKQHCQVATDNAVMLDQSKSCTYIVKTKYGLEIREICGYILTRTKY